MIISANFIIGLFALAISTVSSNLCPASSCNCILTSGTNLEILCSTTLPSSELPTLNNATLQADVISLRVAATSVAVRGPLTVLPPNLCTDYPNIATLDLSFNRIEGLLNTAELACLGSNLLQVDLSDNFINETDVNFFYANRRLRTIDLSSNQLQTMPSIDGGYFLNFITTLISMDLSYNQIVAVDLWPLFVKTRNFMAIDMSHNSIRSFTNSVPVYVKQFTETPDPRAFYLNDNQLSDLSDLLVQRYGACSTISYVSTSYFIVGISNLLLTNNPLECDCESYNLRKFINDRRDDFPLIANGSALINQATCSSPSTFSGMSYLSMNITPSIACLNYTLPSISDAFCSVYTNSSSSTIAPPTYWLTTSTLFSTSNPGGVTSSDSGGETPGSSNNEDRTSNTTGAPAWYVILGIVLGLVVLLALIGISCFLCRDRIFSKKCRSKFHNSIHSSSDSYQRFVRHSELSSQNGYSSNGIRLRRTSTDGASSNDHDYHPEQETQTCFQVNRSKAVPNGRPPPTRNPQRLIANKNIDKNNPNDPPDVPKPVPPKAAHVGHGVKGIPIALAAEKISNTPSNASNSQGDASTFDLNITPILLTPSKRAKLLPPLKGGNYIDSNNHNLLNTSAAGILSNRRQRRLSSSWNHQAPQNFPSSLAHRPQSMTTQKSGFTHEDTSDDDILSIPTVESSMNKSSKPLRALPLLNITVVPAWIDTEN